MNIRPIRYTSPSGKFRLAQWRHWQVVLLQGRLVYAGWNNHNFIRRKQWAPTFMDR